uniref:Uncharacterized protein n=1 Tax=Magallana gigas TaxID=29159 RepID=A0A8W8L5R1_MAGGI
MEASRGSLDNFKFVCRRELNILPEIEIRHRASDDQLSACTKDYVSEAILRRCGMTDRDIPLKSLSDRCCLFSSASIAMTGDNRFVTELRVRTCVEMVTNHEIYKALPNAPDLLDTSPSFDESSLDCA